jgi:hypothetical protein
MKKIVFVVSGILILAFIVLRIIDSTANAQEVKKATTEVTKDCGKCPYSSKCGTATGNTEPVAAKCDPARCKEMGCDPAKCKEGKCNHSTSKKCCAGNGSEAKKCNPAKCAGTAK